eukprot:snap_masked-scaffold_36-processed-gene-0.25-mRNA-1 protein AED:1.00 eAED:1.00 QI:0/-1/0/0/-1/1/1/0/212
MGGFFTKSDSSFKSTESEKEEDENKRNNSGERTELKSILKTGKEELPANKNVSFEMDQDNNRAPLEKKLYRQGTKKIDFGELGLSASDDLLMDISEQDFLEPREPEVKNEELRESRIELEAESTIEAIAEDHHESQREKLTSEGEENERLVLDDEQSSSSSKTLDIESLEKLGEEAGYQRNLTSLPKFSYSEKFGREKVNSTVETLTSIFNS